MRLTGTLGGDIVIMNVYAPNQATARCEFWIELANSMAKDCRWFMAGDWNFVEKHQDKSRNNTHLTTLEERGAFELLKSTFNVHDLFSLSNSIRYSWDNRRDRENRTMARLDRIYSLREFGEIVVASDYTIMANSAFLDHSPMYRSVKLEVEAQQKSPYVMNACYLKHEAVKERTRKEWASHPILPFFGKLRRCIRDYK
jgi:exonuclease III